CPEGLAATSWKGSSGRRGAGGDAGQAQTAAVVPVRRNTEIAVPGPAELGIVHPASASEHPQGFPFLAHNIVAELEHVAVHVVKPQPVRPPGADLARSLEPRLFEVHFARRQCVRRAVEIEVETRTFLVLRGAAAARILPLRRRRQPVLPTALLRPRVHPLDELLAV